ncbi:hypothetical protein HMSSN036_08000 [Paenibacillus macerans]|nr:hypothetical protein HMSSN036_08000 [Paenibacillus macerans]
MFEMVIGDLDVILERFEKEHSLEKSIYKIMLESKSDEEIASRVDSLGRSFHSIKSELDVQTGDNEGGDLKQLLGG